MNAAVDLSRIMERGTVVIAKSNIGEMVRRRERGVVLDELKGVFGPIYVILFESGWQEEMSPGDVHLFLLVSTDKVPMQLECL